MKTNVTTTLLVMLAVHICCVANAEVTDLVNYQSKLKKNGTNEHGQVNVTFRVYTGETNEVCVYQESQQVQVKEGLLSTLIGKNPLQGDIATACKLEAAYLEVEINGNKLKPREKFTPPPFASNATQIWSAFGNASIVGSDALDNLTTLGCVTGWTDIASGIPAWITFPPPSKPVSVKSVKVFYNGARGLLFANQNEVPPLPNPGLVFQIIVQRTNGVSEPIGGNYILPLQITNPQISPPWNITNTSGWNNLPVGTNAEQLIIYPGDYLRVLTLILNITNAPAGQNIGISEPRIMFQAEVR